MKTKLVLILLLVLFQLSNVNSQNFLYRNTPLYSGGAFIGKFVDSSTTYSTGSYAIGKQNPYSGTTSVVYRSYFYYDLTDIPTNATIDTVVVNYFTGTATSYTFKLTKMATISYDYQATWAAVGTSSSAHTGLTYGSNNFMSDPIKTEIQSKLSSRKIILGALGENETANDSYAGLTMSLTVYYKIPAESLPFTAQNDLKGNHTGHIGVGVGATPAAYSSPKSFTAFESQTINLAAYDTINVNNYLWLYNNSEAPLNKSVWKRDWFGDVDSISANQTTSLQANKSFGGATFIAYLKPNYTVTRNDQTEFDITTPFVAAQIIEQNSGSISTQGNGYRPGNITYNFAGWMDDMTASTTRTITPTDNATYTALYKYPFHSNASTAFTNNSQRKYVKTTDGSMHLVYESMGCIWYERSTDNGTTWQIMNGGKPVTISGKNPSIDANFDSQNPTASAIVIVYLTDDTPIGVGTAVTADYYDGGVKLFSSIVASGYGDMNALSIAPVVAMKYDYRILIAWSDDGIVTYRFGYPVTSDNAFYWYNQPTTISTTTAAAQLTIAGCKSWGATPPTNWFQLAWQENNSIYYTSFSSPAYNQVAVGSISNISSGSGYTTNSSPSIIEGNGGARVVWIGERGALPSLAKTTNETNITPPQYERRTIFKDPSYYRYWSFGSNVNSPSINKTDNNSAYVLGWAETNGTVTNKFADNTLSTIRTLNTTGKALQLCNGADKYSMFALSFTNTALPYNFTLSNSIGGIALAKENSSLSVNKGREGVVVKDSSQIYFTLGDVLVNGENISFKTIPDTFSVTSVTDVNNCVKTNPFSVTDNSKFFYSVQYGVSDAEQVKRAFTESDIISFRIELVEAATETVLGVFDNISYTKQNAVSYDNFSYEVSTEGIGNRTVYLRLVTTASEGCSFSITDKLDNQSIIAKRYVKQVAFKSAQVIKDYAMEQNYPNPFNPATTITYQLPKSGSVTLKIYDMLGKEVMTLVNEQKEMGRYTVQFDASSLASGMYVYQLRANDYTSTKKMMLLK